MSRLNFRQFISASLAEPDDGRPAFMVWRIASIIIVGLSAASVLFSVFFTYDTVYRTLNDADTVVLLHSVSTADILNLDQYDKAAAAIKLKETPLVLTSSTRDIFSYARP